jgi:hypothetical protein
VPRDRRPADSKSGDKLVHMRVAPAEAIEDRPPRGIGDCEKYIGCCSSAGRMK